MKRIVCLFVGILFFYLPSSVFAATISLSSNTQTIISSEQELEVDVTLTINVANGTIYYLRGVFAKQNTTSYCGLTWNNTTWFGGPYSSNEGWKNFLAVTITDDSWTGKLKAKIDPESNNCRDSGEYLFKVQRFTTGSGSGNFDDQNSLSVLVTLPTPTTVPTNSSTPTSIPTATKVPTPTKIPTPTKQPSPTKVPTSQPTQTLDKTVKNASTTAYPTAVLTTTVMVSPTNSEAKEKKVLVKSAEKNNLTSFAIISGSICLIGAGIYIFVKKRKNNENNTYE